jgi:hypothetical protein
VPADPDTPDEPDVPDVMPGAEVPDDPDEPVPPDVPEVPDVIPGVDVPDEPFLPLDDQETLYNVPNTRLPLLATIVPTTYWPPDPADELVTFSIQKLLLLPTSVILT